MDITDRGGDGVFFTIIVPTRERSDTLRHTLTTVLSQDYKNFEVLVSDNASQDDTRKVVLGLQDTRLRYINTEARVSMSENWEFALNHVENGWITVLGDDDALLPGALRQINKIINETGTEAIRSNGCSYTWPGLTGGVYGRLNLNLKTGYVFRDSHRALQEVMNGRRSYNELPMLYNGGFMSMDLVKQAKEVTHDFFLSMTPDVYSGVVFGFLTKKYVYSYEPLAINGASLHSGGTAVFEKNKAARTYDPADKFHSENNIPFHDDIPLEKSGRPVRSITILVYEAFLQAEKFHWLKNIQTTPAKQLNIALKSGGPDDDEICEWAVLFAEKHNIRYRKLKSRRVNGVIKKVKTFPARVKNVWQTYTVEGGERLALDNVYEASIVAGTLKVISPGRLRNMFNRLRKWVLHA
jgi:glycosyltransferase involved in cell wall biosynthesis